MSAADISQCVLELDSSKITLRRRSSTQLLQLLEDERIIKILDQSKSMNWVTVLNKTHDYLYLESKKLADDDSKSKKPSSSSYNQGNLITSVVRKASQNARRLPGVKILDCILKFFTSNHMQTFFFDSYLRVLKDYFFLNSQYMVGVPSDYWTGLLNHLKNRYYASKDDTRLLQCLQYFFEKAPLSSFHSHIIRQQFKFIADIAQDQLQKYTKKNCLEITMALLIAFCSQTAKDCRSSCCKLGEDLMETLISLLEMTHYENIQNLIYKFLLLQVKIHHPMGCTHFDPMAFACNWNKWRLSLRQLYSVLHRIISSHLKKNSRILPMAAIQSPVISLNENLTSLGVQVFKQVYKEDLSTSSNSSLTSLEPSAKRIKIDLTINCIIQNIQDSKDWPWINFIKEILKQYPKLLSDQDYLALHQTLSTIQAQCKDNNVRYHLYGCICVLVDIQDEIDDIISPIKQQLNSLWTVIWDMAHRTAGLNQNMEYTHKLIQKLINSKNNLPFTNLFNTYHYGTFVMNEYTLKSLDALCSRFIIPDNLTVDDTFEKFILNWILNVDNNNTRIFSKKITAKVLVSLTLKEWPILFEKSTEKNGKLVSESNYVDIENILCYTSLQRILWTKNTYEQSSETLITKTKLKNVKLLEEIITLIKNYSTLFFENETKDKQKLLVDIINFIILILNVLSELVKHEIILEEDLSEHQLVFKVNEMLSLFLVIFKQYKSELKSSEHSNQNLFESLGMLFRLEAEESVLKIMFKFFPDDIIMILFDVIGPEDSEDNEDDSRNVFDGIQACQEALCSFFCNPYLSEMNSLQIKTVKCFFDYSYELELQQDVDLLIILLTSLTNCKIGSIDDDVLEESFRKINDVCKFYYKNYDKAVILLKIWLDLFPHVVNSKFEQIKIGAAQILQPFYYNCSNYGPNISTLLVDCMGQILKWNLFFKWIEDEFLLAKHLFEFLKSDYQEVRLAAIKNLEILFNDKNQFNQEKPSERISFFDSVATKVEEMFEVDESLIKDSDHRVDEQVSRTSAAFLTLATVIVSSVSKRKSALYFLLKLSHIRKIDISIVKNALTLLSNFLGFENVSEFLKPDVTFIISHWCSDGLDVNKFPFDLLNCTDLETFHEKFVKKLVHIFIKNQRSNILENISEISGQSEREIIKENLPNVLSNYLCNIAKNDLGYLDKFKKLEIDFGEDVIRATIIEELHQIIYNIIDYTYDEAYLREKFDFQYCLPEPNTPYYFVGTVLKTIKLLEEKFLKSHSFVTVCALKFPKKLQDILFKVTTKVVKSSYPEDTIVTFLKYSIFCDILISRIDETQNLSAYFIKDITQTMIYMITSSKTNNALNIFVCTYFESIVPKIVENNSEIFGTMLPEVSGALIETWNKNNNVRSACVKVLTVVICPNVNSLNKFIRMLDPFPDHNDFKQFNAILDETKSNKENKNLREIIENFVNVGSKNSVRSEGFALLRKNISDKRGELEDLYSEMQQLRGFSEDYEDHPLFQLITTLLAASRSGKSEINVEALRCLGELGPLNLATVTLNRQNKYKSAFEPFSVYFAGCILSFLSDYLFDEDISIVQATCDVLYGILETKDGEAALASEEEFVKGKIMSVYFEPFMQSSKIKINCKYSVKIAVFKNLVNVSLLWCPINCSFSEWVVNIVCALLNSFETCYLQELIPLCKVKTEFAQNIFPLLLGFILCNINAECAEIISSHMRSFFEKHWEQSLKDNFDIDKNDIVFNKESVKCLIEAIHFVQILKCNTNVKKKLNELKLNYLHVAKAAQFCSEHFSALQFIEFWSNNRLNELKKTQSNNQFSNDSPLYTIMSNEVEETQQILQDILRESFDKIGDTNALSACRPNISFNSRKEIEIFEQMQKWDQVALQYDIQMPHENSDVTDLLTAALKKSSFISMPFLCRNVQNPQYDCAWRLSNWTISENDKKKQTLSFDFKKEHYFALKAFHEGDEMALSFYLKRARNLVANELKRLNLVSCKSVYDILMRLKCLEELEDFACATKNNNLDAILTKWKINNESNLIDFEYFEGLMSQRIILLKDVIKTKKVNCLNYFSDFYLKLSEYARKEGFDNVSHRALGELKYVINLDTETKYRLIFEEAQLWWKTDKLTAKSKLRQLLKTATNYPKLHSDVLKLYGTWMIETNSESSVTISEYFLKSIDILRKTDNNQENLFEIYDILGKYCDSKYQQVVAYIKSSAFEHKVKNMEKCRKTVNLISQKSSRSITIDEKRTKTLYERQSNIDENEIQSTYKERDNFLEMALKYYVLNLQKSLTNDLRIFKLFSLWLENKNSESVENRLVTELPKIPSYKFIPILPQIVPHLNPNFDNQFNVLVFQIIERCAVDHPHHTLPLVLALSNANLDKTYYKDEKKSNFSAFRIQGAQKLLEKLRRSTSKDLVLKMELLSTALVELAYLDIETCKNVRGSSDDYHIKSSCRIMKIKNFDDVLLPTYPLKVSKSKDYSNLVGIASFGETFTGVGGINAPKRISCLGTDGVKRHQLVKGKDDLRQDAVMQQVFNIMNEFLASNKQTFKQKLRIRTYKVVPLSQRSGILQWVENSIPLGEYLVGRDHKTGAHQRYNKDDYTSQKCRNEIASVAKASNQQKYETFLKVCKNFRPVFFKFFEEFFPDPAAWYERRQAYIKSVATTSMCGYILGIGDRHVHNILINKETAEVVHIDFGIAFEQGKVLPTPETVPFRLTRDMVSGMGICGIEGVFQRACEKTMEVLRNNSETIVTILEVLLYDPLYAWSITPSQAYSKQFSKEMDTKQLENNQNSSNDSSPDDTQVSLNTMAERALLRLREKLKGTEEGSVTSVEGQVEKLIQQATDPANLCKLFYGWQAYL